MSLVDRASRLELAVLVLAIMALMTIAPPAESRDRIEAGTLLVAGKSLRDPNFRETVVLIFDRGSHGTGGVIVNRATGIALREAFPSRESLQYRKDVLWQGGPVMPRSLTAIVRSPVEEKGEGLEIIEGVQMVDPSQALEQLDRLALGSDQIRIFAGHAGWMPGQLEAEIARGDWELIPPRLDWIFSSDPESLWETLIKLAVLPTT